MATRTKPEDTRWLAGWKEIPGSDTTALDPLNGLQTTHESLTTLTQLGFLVRIVGVAGNYQVQCITMRDTPYRLKEPVGLSYAGAHLDDVLAAAAYEADLLVTAPSDAQYRIGERARWVQS